MEQLTATQAKMVIEYFARQAAEDAPEGMQGDREFDRHTWMTQYAASIAIERQIKEHEWFMVMVNMMDWQSFDRDPDAYLHERGYDATGGQRDYMACVLEDLVSWSIDEALRTSGA